MDEEEFARVLQAALRAPRPGLHLCGLCTAFASTPAGVFVRGMPMRCRARRKGGAARRGGRTRSWRCRARRRWSKRRLRAPQSMRARAARAARAAEAARVGRAGSLEWGRSSSRRCGTRPPGAGSEAGRCGRSTGSPRLLAFRDCCLPRGLTVTRRRRVCIAVTVARMCPQGLVRYATLVARAMLEARPAATPRRGAGGNGAEIGCCAAGAPKELTCGRRRAGGARGCGGGGGGGGFGGVAHAGGPKHPIPGALPNPRARTGGGMGVQRSPRGRGRRALGSLRSALRALS
jgi:hypothetical protein